tara:strand:- start:2259 stop:3152 length:894 start_codon:yes stop_codon:yes gene_type:complete
LTIAKITGLVPILQTPFDRKGRIDTEALRELVNYNIDSGVDGLGIALASEVPLLTETERNELLRIVVDETNSRVPVVMNTGGNGNELAVHYSRKAEELGASAVMLTPPESKLTSRNPSAIKQYFQDVVLAVKTSIVIQDVEFAQVPPKMVADLAKHHPAIVACKMETPPTANRIADTVNTVNGDIEVLGGGGATYLIEELARGSKGTMPFSSTPVEFAKVLALHKKGEVDLARKIFKERISPLCHLVSQSPTIAIQLHKQILKKKGLIPSSKVRQPAALIDKHTQRDIDELLEKLIV